MTIHRPTMRHVAEHAGVSLNVVSRVCNPRPNEYVSEAARQRVLAAIEALGYHPDSRARSLRSLRAQTVGYYSGYGTVNLDQEFARVIFDGLQAGCGELDQDLLIFHAMDRCPMEEIVRELANTKVDGIVYHPRQGDAALAALLLQTHKPVVRIGEPFPGVPTVVAEDWYGAKRLAHHLYVRGHRRVVFRKEPSGLVSANRRYAGFCEAAEELGMSVITTATDSEVEELTDEEQQLLTSFRSEGFTAVACWRDWSAAKVLVFCREHHIHVPEDLAVVGFDGLTPTFCPTDLRMTTIVIDWQRIAELAVAKLLDRIEERPVPDETVHTCSIYPGNTT